MNAGERQFSRVNVNAPRTDRLTLHWGIAISRNYTIMPVWLLLLDSLIENTSKFSSRKGVESMPRVSNRDAISQAVSDIGNLHSMEDLSSTAIKQGVVLRVLSAAGWNPFDLAEVEPEYRTGNSRVDFVLKSPLPGRGRTATAPKILVEVRALSENLESERYQRQLMAHCAREEVSLGALTNGPRWLLLFWSEGDDRGERRFCELDLLGNPAGAAEDINRYLSKDRVSSGQAARSAERALQDQNRDETTRRAILGGFRQVVGGLDEGLIELVATASEQRTGARPENRFVRRVLMEHRSELLAGAEEEATSPSSRGGGSRRRPASFTFQSETVTVSSWPDLMLGVCSLMLERHPDSFERILEIRGRTLPYFSRTEDELNLPRQVGESGIYASCQGAGVLIEARARRVVELFGYSGDSLSIQTR